jgi:hypothetical protein
MAGFAQMGTMDIWYAHLDEDQVMSSIRAVAGTAGGAKNAKQAKGKKEKAGGKDAKLARKAEKRAQKTVVKAHASDSLHALSKLGEMVNGRYQIVSQPPIVVPVREMATTYGQDFVTRYHLSPGEVMPAVQDQFRAYRATMQADRQLLLDRYEIVDMARKVVGVGSVGTRAFIVLLQGRDASDPLFLQVKEATASVLESHLPKSRFRNHGERVVQGQRLMQAASDIYLGWTKGHDVRRHFYWRQLRDMKGSAVVETMTPLGLGFYAQMCGWTLARAHARSGDPVAIAEYLGTDDAFDESVTDFSERYADQNERDYEEFVAAVRSGRVAAVEGLLSDKLTRPLSARNLRTQREFRAPRSGHRGHETAGSGHRYEHAGDRSRLGRTERALAPRTQPPQPDPAVDAGSPRAAAADGAVAAAGRARAAVRAVPGQPARDQPVHRPQFVQYFNQSVREFAYPIATDNPDLTAFEHDGGKILIWHGLADQLIFPQGTIQYYQRVQDTMGTENTATFARLFIARGAAHCGPGAGPAPANPLDADAVAAEVDGLDQGGADAAHRVGDEVARGGVAGDRGGGDRRQHLSRVRQRGGRGSGRRAGRGRRAAPWPIPTAAAHLCRPCVLTTGGRCPGLRAGGGRGQSWQVPPGRASRSRSVCTGRCRV